MIFRRIGGRIIPIIAAGDWTMHTPKNMARMHRLTKKAEQVEKAAMGIAGSASVLFGSKATRTAGTRIGNRAAKGGISRNFSWAATAMATGKHPADGSKIAPSWIRQKTKIAVEQLRAAHSFVRKHRGLK